MVVLQEVKAIGHTGRKGNRSRSYCRKKRQQVILQEGKATGQGHTTGRKDNRSYYRKEGNRSSYMKESQQVTLQEGKATGHTTGSKGKQVIQKEEKATDPTTGRKGNRSHYRK